MAITIIRQTKSGLKTSSFSKQTVIITVVCCLLLVSFVLQLGILLGKTSQTNQVLTQPLMADISVDAQSKDNQAQQQYEEQLKQMHAKIAFLQAQMSRLDALGSRVVEKVKLDPEEFNFAELPPIGGFAESSAAPSNPQLLLQELNNLETELAQQSPQIEYLESIVTETALSSENRISGKPTRGGWISSFYGWRNDPFHGNKAWHKGFDFAGKEDADVVATASGIISYAGDRYGYGLLVEITHSNGYVTRYGHNKSITVKKGDVVKKGDTIARMGSTGRSTGPHVHYEVLKNGKQVDPKRYVYR